MASLFLHPHSLIPFQKSLKPVSITTLLPYIKTCRPKDQCDFHKHPDICAMYTPTRPTAQEERGRAQRLLYTRRRKRCNTLINKAHDLATKCNVHVYVLVRHSGRYISYSSLDHPNWPPPNAAVVSSTIPSDLGKVLIFSRQEAIHFRNC